MQPRALFHIGDIPVQVTPMFFLVSLLLSGGRSVLEVVSWTVIVFISVLVHELGHALAMRGFGGEPVIELHGMGGTTYWQSRASLTPGRSVLVSLAGPFAGFALGAVVLLVRKLVPETNDATARIYFLLLFVNFGWGAFNLLPIVPLDGGHVLRSLVALRWPRQAELVADVVALLVGVPVIVLALLVEWPWPAIIVALVAWPSAVRMRGHVARMRDAITYAGVETLFTRAVAENAQADVAAAEALVDAARTDAGRRAAAEALVWACIDAGDRARVDEVLRTHLDGAALGAAVASRVDTLRGHERTAIARLEREGGLSGPLERLAYVEACVEAGEIERCAAQLGRARARGLDAELLGLVERFARMGMLERALGVCEVGHLATETARFSFEAARLLVRLDREDEARAALELARARPDAHTLALDVPELVALRDQSSGR